MSDSLSLEAVRFDDKTRVRAALDEEVIDDYAEQWEGVEEGEYPFSTPIDVFFDGTYYWCADGFHRGIAAQKAGRNVITATVHEGTWEDAFLFASKCNCDHGLRRSNEDKRYIINKYLTSKKWGKQSARWIAETCGVSNNFVSTIRNGLAEENQTSSDDNRMTVETQDGKTRAVRKKKKKKSTSGNKPPASDSEDSTQQDYGTCPSCAGTKWNDDDAEGDVWCSKCHHPHGEPATEVDDDRVKTQRQKTVKTVEALMRAFDDLHLLLPKQSVHKRSIDLCKGMLDTLDEWK